jgi:glycosyltransferase involved in cell wall biosynthesis
LRVGIDYYPALTHAPGVGRYTRELVRALVALEDGPALALFDVGPAPRVIDTGASGLSFARPTLRRMLRTWPRRILPYLARVGLGADRLLGGCDVFHQVLPDAPRTNRARETLALAELPPPGSPADHKLGLLLGRVRAVFVFSSDFQRRVQQRFSFRGDRVFRVSVGCEHWRRELAALSPPPARARILVLGGLRTERRPMSVLAAFEKLRADGLAAEIVFVGRTGNAARQLGEAQAASRFASDIRVRTDVSEQELPALVSGASCLVHISADEGTPVTPLEAFALGIPVVASRLPAFEEALGGLAELLDPAEHLREPRRLSDAIARAVASRTDESASDARVRLARTFTWARSASETLAAWRVVHAQPER